MMPNGYGAAYYSGQTKIGKKIRYGTPIKSLNGLWKAIVVVLEKADAEAKYETLEAYLDPKISYNDTRTDLKIIQDFYPEETSIPQIETPTELPSTEILWKILYPTLDTITIFPVIWISGIGPSDGELYINDHKRIIKTFDKDPHFWEPVELQKGSQLLSLESRMENNQFRHEVNVYYLETTNHVLELLKEPLRRSMVLKGSYQPDNNPIKLDSDYKFGKTIKWIYPQNETTTLTKTVRIYGEVEEFVDALILNDGQDIPLTKISTGKKFDLTLPVKIGTTELVLRTIINGETAEIVSRNINVQFSPNTLPSLQIIRPQQNFVVTNKNSPIMIEGFTTPGTIIFVNDHKITPNNEGHFMMKMPLNQKIKPESEVKFSITSVWDPLSVKIPNSYDFARPLTMKIDTFNEISPSIRKQLQKSGYDTLDQIRKADIRILAKSRKEASDYLRVVNFAGLLLVSKDNLAIFKSYEALALAEISYESLEVLILEKPEDLIRKFSELKIANISKDDIICWQKSLDDYLFDVQNVWL